MAHHPMTARVGVVYAAEPNVEGGGSELRARALASQLAKDHPVDYVQLNDGIRGVRRAAARIRATLLGVPPRLTQVHSRKNRVAMRSLLARYDVLIVATVFTFSLIPRNQRSKCIFDAHNLEHIVTQQLADSAQGLRRLAYAATVPWTRRYERSAAVASLSVWAVSRAEAEWFRRDRDRGVALVRNGVDAPSDEALSVGDCHTRGDTFIFTGSLRSDFNRSGVAWFLEHVWPSILVGHPSATLLLVGAGSTDFSGPNVEPQGYVVATAPFYKKADIAIVPLQSGAGTRLKVVEAMGWRTAVLTTSVGCEGIELVPGYHACVADTAADFIAMANHLVASPDEREEMANRGRLLALETYDWNVIGRVASDALATVLKAGET